jgi:hypothetical protein
LLGLVVWCRGGFAAEVAGLADALLFHASFDESVDADLAKGDAALYTADSLARERVRPGLVTDAAVLDKEGGRFGGALSFRKKADPVVFYRGGENLPYTDLQFQGTISFWMLLSPAEDLPPGYVDPLQITDKAWNDASIFVDFTETNPRQFRLGIFSDYKFWNPTDRPWDDIPDAERPMVSVEEPPFSRDHWTHVAITFRDFNAPDAEGLAVLYLDGKPQGQLRGKQRFTWDADNAAIMLGIAYVGRLDDFAVFNRALDEPEILELFSLPGGIESLR